MGRKLIFVLVFLFLMFPALTVDATTIIKVGRDINISKNQRVDSAIAFGGQVTVSGLVENHVVSVGGSVVLTGDAVVRGHVICIGGIVVRGNGARVYGRITEVNASSFFAAVSPVFYDDAETWSWLTDIIYICFLAFLFMMALMTAFLFPRPLKTIISTLEKNKVKSFFWGILGSLMIAPFFTLLVFSFIGIPLIPLAFSIILLFFMFGFIAASALLGKFVLKKVFRYHHPSLVRETLLGLILWWIIGRAPFYAGAMIEAVVMITGFGGVLFAVFHRDSDGDNRRQPAFPALK